MQEKLENFFSSICWTLCYYDIMQVGSGALWIYKLAQSFSKALTKILELFIQVQL